MPTIRFVGKVLPQTLTINFADSQPTNWGSDELGFPLVMRARIRNSQIEVACDLPVYDESKLSTLLARAYNLVDAYVNAASFSTGIGLWTELYAVDRGDQQLMAISRENEELSPLCTAFKIPSVTPQELWDFAESIRIILAEPNLLGSLSDLAQTLNHFHYTPTNCGRVIDSLRRAVAPNLDKKQGWLVLQQTINADSDYTTWISKYSNDPRHGDRETEIPKEIVDEIRKRTWNIMNRILEYRKGGNRPLDRIKFPQLVHDPAFPFPTSQP